MAEEAKTESSAKPPMNLGKVLGLVFAVLNIGAMGAGAFYIYTQTLGLETPSTSDSQALRELAEFRKTLQREPAVYTMDPLSTNLDGVPRRLVRVQISLEMLDEEGFEEVLNLGAGARDAIMRILNAKVYNDLESVQGKLQLKNQIIAQLNSAMKRGVVRQVYFNDFVIQ
jgi:flagellar FliL protein